MPYIPQIYFPSIFFLLWLYLWYFFSYKLILNFYIIKCIHIFWIFMFCLVRPQADLSILVEPRLQLCFLSTVQLLKFLCRSSASKQLFLFNLFCVAWVDQRPIKNFYWLLGVLLCSHLLLGILVLNTRHLNINKTLIYPLLSK